MTRTLIVLAGGVGIGCISLALGFLYKDVTHRESALYLLAHADRLTPQERAGVIARSAETPYFPHALISGTLGVMMLGGGVAGAVMESRLVRRPDTVEI